jgi:hypothetical protein
LLKNAKELSRVFSSEIRLLSLRLVRNKIPINVRFEQSKDRAALANVPKTNAFPGGIDLSQQDSALHIEKDANGGVKVDVDPAMIARVEREGMTEIDPVIIGMRPADVQSLFGVKILTTTP